MCRCLECGAEISDPVKVKNKASFCSVEHRKAYNNLRAMRGAILYDLYYGNRYDRDRARELGAWSAATRFMEKWRGEDVAAGRLMPNWVAQILNNPWLGGERGKIKLGRMK